MAPKSVDLGYVWLRSGAGNENIVLASQAKYIDYMQYAYDVYFYPSTTPAWLVP